MTLLFHNHQGVGYVLLAQAGETEPFRFKVYGKQKGKIVQECRDAGSKQDFCVAYPHEFCHDKADGSHDGWGELTSGGSNSLHCGGKLLLVAGFLHHRDGYGSCGSDIGDGRTVDHA
ncbi:hypothetical protein SDC9_97216 [bioreactor metagenome]|uniref:Uncharacterized protein n=1 Tax=bioreactor metagenome TaxID=1076179 RepID=A0A645AB90_9ZZZZ